MPFNKGVAVDYLLVDADNHYYEAEDAFLRHGDESVRRYVRWVTEGKKKHLLFGSRLSTGIPNPTFNPIARAGVFHARLKELEQGTADRSGPFDNSMFGELEPIDPAYRDREERLAALDRQGLERCFLFPTLGDCVEGLMHDNVTMAYKVFHAFNLWLEEDWGYGYRDRLYAPPYIPMLDPELAALELEFVLDKGARIVSLRPGPAAGRSPADPVWDPFWARLDEAGALAAYHAFGGPTLYGENFERMWGAQPVSDPRYLSDLSAALVSDRGILDTVIALVLGNLFGRFPNVRVASVEMGCNWVPYCLHVLDHAGGILERRVDAFGVRLEQLPSDIFKERVYVSPFPEEDVVGLADLIGADRVLFGSDWPHAEGNVEPIDYLACLNKLAGEDVRKIMRDNALSLLSPP
jgi:predicted TIM-barrel fold metal-dependent hydrolase